MLDSRNKIFSRQLYLHIKISGGGVCTALYEIILSFVVAQERENN